MRKRMSPRQRAMQQRQKLRSIRNRGHKDKRKVPKVEIKGAAGREEKAKAKGRPKRGPAGRVASSRVRGEGEEGYKPKKSVVKGGKGVKKKVTPKVPKKKNEKEPKKVPKKAEVKKKVAPKKKEVKKKVDREAPVKTNKQGYSTYRKDSKMAKSFRKAFDDARQLGQRTFPWNGKVYSTKMKKKR